MKMALSGLQSSLIRRFTRGGDASGRGRKERRRKGRKEGRRNAKPSSFRMGNAHW